MTKTFEIYVEVVVDIDDIDEITMEELVQDQIESIAPIRSYRVVDINAKEHAF